MEHTEVHQTEDMCCSGTRECRWSERKRSQRKRTQRYTKQQTHVAIESEDFVGEKRRRVQRCSVGEKWRSTQKCIDRGNTM
jgi:hypothetical protein